MKKIIQIVAVHYDWYDQSKGEVMQKFRIVALDEDGQTWISIRGGWAKYPTDSRED